jgi:AbrB family looped-hinge helix DNA binding protein
MNAIVEIDKSGRIVVPKKLRDALHLTPGTRIKVERAGHSLILEPDIGYARLVIENGLPLIFPTEGFAGPSLDNDQVIDLIEQGRLERDRRILGLEGDFEVKN